MKEENFMQLMSLGEIYYKKFETLLSNLIRDIDKIENVKVIDFDATISLIIFDNLLSLLRWRSLASNIDLRIYVKTVLDAAYNSMMVRIAQQEGDFSDSDIQKLIEESLKRKN